MPLTVTVSTIAECLRTDCNILGDIKIILWVRKGLELTGNKPGTPFYILLTVHHVMILGKWPTWCTNFFYIYLFLFTTLYMFRAHRAHHQERKIVSIQPLVTVILCWWPRCVQIGRRLLLPICTHLGYQHRMTVTTGCINIICLSWWWAWCARNT